MSTDAKLKQIVSDILGVGEDEIQDDTKLVADLAADELDLIEIACEIEDEFSIDLDDSFEDPLMTFSQMKEKVEALLR